MIEIIDWGNLGSKAEWLEMRKKVNGSGETYTRVGASAMSVITGVNKWMSKKRLFLELAGIYSKDNVSYLGTQGGLMESVTIQRWESMVVGDEEQSLKNARDSVRVRKVKEAKFFVLNSKYPHLSASLDAVPDEEDYVNPFTGEVLPPLTPHEMKYISPDSYKSWRGVISEGYYQQVQIQMAMTETKMAMFLPLCWDFKFYPVVIHYDEKVADYCIKAAKEFTDKVSRVKVLLKQLEDSTLDDFQRDLINGEINSLIPDDDTIKDTVELSNEMHNPADYSNAKDKYLKNVDVESIENLLMAEYVVLKDKESEIEGLLNNTKSRLIDLCDNYEGFNSPNYKATIRGRNSKKATYFRVDVKGEVSN